MKRTFRFLLGHAILIFLFTGCQTPTRTAKLADIDGSDYLISKTYGAADELVKQLEKLHSNDGFVVASFVDINSLGRTNSFGLISAEQFASRLAQHGLKILDIKLRKEDILIQSSETSGGNPGEFLLSRNLKEGIGPQHDVSAVVVGMYTTTRYGRNTHVSVRVLRVEDGSILAAHDFSLENREIQGLLRGANTQNITVNLTDVFEIPL